MNQLSGYNGVRAIACLMVVFHHISQRMNYSFAPDWMHSYLQFGYQANIGVSIFFVLSGALLSYPFWQSIINKTPTPKSKVFFIRRFARIAPGFYLSLTVSFVLSFTLFGSTLDTQLIIRYISGLFFISDFHYITLFPVDVNGPLWSIGFEVFSYCLLFAVMYFFISGLKRSTFKESLVYLLFVFCLAVFLHILIYKFMPVINEGRGWQFGLTGGALLWMPGYNPISLFLHFFFGILSSCVLVYLLSMKQPKDGWMDGFIIVNWILFLIYIDFSPQGTFLNIPYFWPFFPLLIGITLTCLPFTKFLAKILDNRFFNFTANVSFGLYIWHFLVMALIQKFMFEQYDVFQTKSLTVFFIASGCTLVFSYLIATLSFYLIERPVQKWSRTFN